MMQRILVAVFLLCACVSCSNAQDSKIQAFDFPPGLQWLNVEKPISLQELKGKFVLLDFWTFCCINCQHILPELKQLEEKYPNELVVVGVHSAKFSSEGITDNIREAILRHDISHPVVNDPDLLLWHAYGVNAWPTVILINPDGNVILVKSGEGVFNPIDIEIQKNISAYKDKLNLNPIALSLEKNKKPTGLLSFPSKIISDPITKHLLIADSGHDRVIIIDALGNVVETIGSGNKGRKDGDFSTAEFSHPQGLALNNNLLYIADTENHLIRVADLSTKQVTTIKSNERLSSPWDLAITQNILFIAMAGYHQIWLMDLSHNTIKPFAGNGQENLVNGSLESSSFAQPSGLTVEGNHLFVADSEVSAIRDIELGANPNVQTILGKGLFEFGDQEGSLDGALLQHPLGLYTHNHKIYVADTYNNKIKTIDLNTRSIKTFAAGLNEPGGLCFLNDKFYIADTNNNRIVTVSSTRGAVQAFDIHPKVVVPPLNLNKFVGHHFLLPVQSHPTSITLNLNLEKGYELLKPSQSFIRIYGEDLSQISKIKIEGTSATINLPTHAHKKLYIETSIFFCRHGAQGLCLMRQILFELPIKGDKETPVAISLDLPSEKFK